MRSSNMLDVTLTHVAACIKQCAKYPMDQAAAYAPWYDESSFGHGRAYAGYSAVPTAGLA